MQYRVAAYKCKVNSVIELSDNITPVGAVYVGDDLFIICLDPLEERHLPEAEEKEEEKVVSKDTHNAG